MPRQLTFDLGARPARGRGDFFVSEANAHAVAMIDSGIAVSVMNVVRRFSKNRNKITKTSTPPSANSAMPCVLGSSTHSNASTYTSKYHASTSAGARLVNKAKLPVIISLWIWCA